MYFFFHLFTGLVIGILLADLLQDRRWIIPCTIGSVLPDLIDKPLGHLLFAGSLGYGRIYAHTLLFFGFLLVAGILLWKYRKSVFFFGLAAGVLSHQVLDQLWARPATWYWPLFGPFQGRLPENYWLVLIQQELENPVEIATGTILCVGVIVYLLYRDRIMGSDIGRGMLKSALLVLALALLVVSGVVLGRALAGDPLPFPGMSDRENAILAGIVLVLASFAAWRLYDAVPAGPQGRAGNFGGKTLR